ncbi:MAG: 50S ribosomal protein L11 methyltransferase [Clostridia bacterium]|nr:50S ribosomal protein L11 methyltransferase [Clostridia bacterium]
MNDWTDITLQINSSDVDTVTAIAQMCMPGGIYIEDYSDFDTDIQQFGPVEIIDEDLLKKAQDKEHATVHLYISPEEDPEESLSFLAERLTACDVAYTVLSGIVKEEDWANNWKQYFKPLPVGEKLLIVPSWEEEIPEGLEDRTHLEIDPGMAFGSGQHETTKLCLEMVEKCVTPGSSVLDVGTGSGILAIGALLLGAKEAVGIDIDKLSVKIAGENAALNGVSDRFRAVCGDLATGISGKFELVCANIVADIILRLLPDVGPLMTDDGDLIVSGIIEERKQDVLDGLAEYGFEPIDILQDRGWCCMRAKKK